MAFAITPLTFETTKNPDVPKEQKTGLLYGIFGHLGSPITYTIAMMLLGVTPWRAFWVFMLVSFVFILFTLRAEKQHASIQLPKPTRKELWDGLVMVFVKGVGLGGGLVLLGWWAFSHIPLWHPVSADDNNHWWLILIATLGTDAAYYTIHRLMSHSTGKNPILRFYRIKHGAHHVVTELDFMRGNQSSWMDTAVTQFQPSLVLISWVLGMGLGDTLVAYALILALQATDHTSVTYYIGPLSHIFMDNHAHKFHHCKRGNLINHAAAFSMWDRWFGTYYENWDLSSNYLHHHGISLPIKPVRPDVKRSASPQQAAA